MSDKFNLKKVINASGKMTILGGSIVNEEILFEMNEALKKFVVMEDLVKESGKYISKFFNSESAFVTSSASAGIAMSIASLITKDSLYAVENLYEVARKKSHEVIMLKGHNINYGAPIRLMVSMGGGTVVEAGYSNECKKDHVEGLISENTIALLYVKSHHGVQKNMLSIEEMKELSNKYNLPLIIDAAAEDNLLKYTALGDIVVYSGTKALESSTSGLVVGKEKYLKNIILQNKGIGRGMKVGRESIFGITKALELFSKGENNSKLKYSDLENFIKRLDEIDGLNGSIVKDDQGRDFYRIELTFLKRDAAEISSLLKNGEIAIYTRDYLKNIGKLHLDTRSINTDDLDTIYKELLKLLNEGER